MGRRQVATVSEVARDVIEGIEDFISDLSPGDFVLIALGLFAIGWVFAVVRAVTRLGPIEVEPLEYDGGDQDIADVKALTARLREHLAKSGLAPPTEVPASTPETDLISAIEASNIPQGAWIAKLLEMMPKPPSPIRYRVSGTLIGKPNSRKCGVSFWLRPSRAGSELLETIENKQSHEDAVECAAVKIFLHISNDAVYVFPAWARWRKERAFEAYRDGMRAREDGRHAAARLLFERARREEPRNLLARVQLASLDERDAAVPGRPFAELLRAAALGAYLEAATERPDLVEARYRTSILCSEIAAWWAGQQSPNDRAWLRTALGGLASSDAQVEPTLRSLADSEAKAVHQILRAPYILLRQGRLRNRYELHGRERRELKRAACITIHCIKVRRYTDARAFGPGADANLVRRRISVRFWHLVPGASRGWQAHYNAGCFYALLHEHEQRRNAVPWQRRMVRFLRRRRWLRWFIRLRMILRLRKPYRTGKLHRLRKRAYKHLSLASEEARDQLAAQWLEVGDPDLQSLRVADEDDWRLLLRRHRGTRRPTRGAGELPDRAWGDPRSRRKLWVALTVVLSVASVVLALSFQEELMLLGLLGALVTAFRAFLAHKESERFDVAAA